MLIGVEFRNQLDKTLRGCGPNNKTAFPDDVIKKIDWEKNIIWVEPSEEIKREQDLYWFSFENLRIFIHKNLVVAIYRDIAPREY